MLALYAHCKSLWQRDETVDPIEANDTKNETKNYILFVRASTDLLLSFGGKGPHKNE